MTAYRALSFLAALKLSRLALAELRRLVDGCLVLARRHWQCVDPDV